VICTSPRVLATQGMPAADTVRSLTDLLALDPDSETCSCMQCPVADLGQ